MKNKKMEAYTIEGYNFVDKYEELESGETSISTYSDINGEWVLLKTIIEPPKKVYTEEELREDEEPSFFAWFWAFFFMALIPPVGFILLFNCISKSKNPVETGIAVGVASTFMNRK